VRRARPAAAVSFLALAALSYARPAAAWLVHEHDSIGGAAVSTLSAPDRETLQAAWDLGRSTRADGTARYCAHVGDVISWSNVHDDSHWCVALPTLAALAGDHACIPEEVTWAVEEGPFLGPLLVEARDRQREVAELRVDDVDQRTRAWREHNMALQDIDPDLVPRARNNRSHFLTALDVVHGQRGASASDLETYLTRSLAPDAPVNATAMYLHYHLVALREATAVRSCMPGGAASTCDAASKARVWRALLAEAFAAHFLEDAFSTGHTVGTWGDLGERLGSHDHYSTRGLDVRTWSGRLYTAHGDAFLSPEDEQTAAAAVATSLAQLATAFRPSAPAPWGARAASQGEPRYSACDRSLRAPGELASFVRQPFVSDVLRQVPIPASRAYGMPRFRSEVGAFLGLLLEGNAFAAFGASQSLPTTDARMRVGAGVGFALEGAFTRFMDGRFFVDLMLAVSMHEYAVGRRAIGFGARLRMPFFLLPGDAIYLAAPVALIDSRLAYTLGTTAAAGGITGIQRQVILDDHLSMQFMLGREAALTWFPHVGWQLEIPVFELRGDRLFTGAFATESVIQLGATLAWNGSERSYGMFASFAERVRRYMPQGCDDDCD